MGHPTAFGACAVILGQAGLHIGLGKSGFVELFGPAPRHLRPDAIDTTRGVGTVFPALSLALIRLHQGDPPPPRPPTPWPAPSGPGRRYRRCAWRPGHTG